MWVYDCFEGDDLEIAWVQHDLYFGKDIPSGHGIEGRFYTLGWWWEVLLDQARHRHRAIRWLGRNIGRLERVGAFSHKVLQLRHLHVAAYYRWITTRGERPTLPDDKAARRLILLDGWGSWVGLELQRLVEDDEVLVANAKLILYRYFDAADHAAERLDTLLVERYGLECMTRTFRVQEPLMLAAAERRRKTLHDRSRGDAAP